MTNCGEENVKSSWSKNRYGSVNEIQKEVKCYLFPWHYLYVINPYHYYGYVMLLMLCNECSSDLKNCSIHSMYANQGSFPGVYFPEKRPSYSPALTLCVSLPARKNVYFFLVTNFLCVLTGQIPICCSLTLYMSLLVQ